MLRFIIRRQRYDGECLNALKTFYETVDCEAAALEKVLCSGGQGGGPDGTAFERAELIGAEVLQAGRD